MLNKQKKWLKASAFVALLGIAPEMFAQAVIFPQEKQPGLAQSAHSGNVFTLSNDLLSASFTQQDGILKFDGCAAMNLQAGNDLFQIQVGNGSKTIHSSEMTLVSVVEKTLDVEPTKAKGSLRIPGKAIEANYTYQKDGYNFKIVWRAVLRNESHYLRTEMDITANENLQMYSIIPMRYTVDNTTNREVPAVVGNTRGAIIMSDKIFAGLETPTAFNTVESKGAAIDMNRFTPTSWTPTSFIWTPGKDLPADIKKMGFTETEVVGMRGYVKFYKEGEQKITFIYKKNPHKLDIVGVDILDKDGNVISHDYHKGYAGGNLIDNVYTIKVPKAECYQVRYFIETKSESIDSYGDIQYNNKIAAAEVKFVKNPAPAIAALRSSRAVANTTLVENEVFSENWNKDNWQALPEGFEYPFRLKEMGYQPEQVKYYEQQQVKIDQKGLLDIEVLYKQGAKRLDIAGVALIDANGKEATYDYHNGNTGSEHNKNHYQLNVSNTGTYTLRYYVVNVPQDFASTGVFNVKLNVKYFVELPAPDQSIIQGLWSRKVVLEKGKTWHVSAVVGLVAENQKRRSVLSYVERERAVPWRAYPIYNSWYELNINRNNDRNYDGNMHDYQCSDIVKQWQKHLYEPYGEGIKAFVWDDGWDVYGTWKFNKNFPKGFSEQDKLAKEMDSGIGAWLGPVGGYGESGNYRREYWNAENRGGMRLSNPKYYKVFREACDNLMNKQGYDFRYFKFDGISDLFSATGPKNSATGDEDAEAIIHAELDMRTLKDDIFFNTSVGTWASPFWFSITDAVWRQENDYGEIGNNNNTRENWITYRDRLVYQNFVQNSPMCPINNLMTHGFILSDFGPVSKDRNYDVIVREMRCAFACGSAMVELYNDYKLMNNINNGKLWEELAKCIAWQKKNEEVLPDIHWVGGNPWDGSKCNVYGWAAWNKKNAVLTLRNGANDAQTFETTLREALDIPAYFNEPITLQKGFADQANLEGLEVGKPIGLDDKLVLKLPGSSVFVFDNTVAKPVEKVVLTDVSKINNRTGFTIKSVNRGFLKHDPNDAFVVSNYANNNLVDATPEGLISEQFAFLRNDKMPEGKFYMYSLSAKMFVSMESASSIKMELTENPKDMVTLIPVAAKDNKQFCITFADRRNINLTSWQHYRGTKLVVTAPDDGNKMTITSVNNKAMTADALSKIEESQIRTVLDRTNWKVSASSWCYDNSEKTQGQPTNVIDDNKSSFWHTNYKGNGGVGQAGMPHSLGINLGAVEKINQFGYVPRTDSENGRIKNYVFAVSDDSLNWHVVQSGTIENNVRQLRWVKLHKTVSGQYVRFTVTSNQKNNNFVCLSEFYLAHDTAAVSPKIHNLPDFSNEEAPAWYPVYFKNGNPQGYIEDKGADQILMTAAKDDAKNEQKWQFIGHEDGYLMKSKAGRYVTFSDGFFRTTTDKEQASTLQFVQSSNFYLEIRVKGAANNMNQHQGQGINKKLAAYTPGNAGNILQVKEVVIPAPEMPVFSTATRSAWYMVKFRRESHVLKDMGENASVRNAKAIPSTATLWKLEGDRNNFQLISQDGRYAFVSNESESQTGPQANANDKPLRTSTEAYSYGFKLVPSTNATYSPAWEIASNDPQFNGKAFNQFAGPNEGRTIGQWTVGDINNPLEFVPVEVGTIDIKTVEGYSTLYVDKNYVMPVGLQGTTIKAVNEGNGEVGSLATEWEYSNGTIVPAHTALLINGTKGNHYFYYTKMQASQEPGENLLRGTLEQTEISPEMNTKYYMLTYSMVNGSKTLGFFWNKAYGAGITNGANRAYLALPGNMKVKGFRLDDLINGIEGTPIEEESETVIYDLAGVRINAALNELPKGLYIVNGKKVIIK